MTVRSLLILPVLLSAVCYAQEAESRARRQSPDREPPLVSMTFRGGTMARFVAEIRKAEPKCNIVVADAAAVAELPPMEVQDAGLDQVLDSACAVATSKMRIACQEQRGRGVPVFAILALPRQVSGVNVAATGFGKPANVTTMVLSLNRLTEDEPRLAIDGLKVETILSALETGARFDEKAPLMRYHEDSGLLFLRGTHEQLSLASDVLKILERDLKELARTRGTQRRSGGNRQPSEPALPSGSTKKRRAR
ncbi:MAG: hypothetical protein NXI31_03730 [bacterium]|nr:hypothetical protein [bacterium]